MNLSPQLLPLSLLFSADIIYGLIILATLYYAPWHHLKNSQDSHVLFASYVLVLFIWRLGGGVTSGLEFHLLLVTSLTLMFGVSFAIIGVSILQLGLSILGLADWQSHSMNVLCNGIAPILMTYALYRFSYLYLPRHFFIYIFVCSFIGGALSMLISRCLGMGLLLLNNTYTWSQLGDEPFFIIVMLFPEAFLNGMIMTILVVYRPQWVSSFNDKYYLVGK